MNKFVIGVIISISTLFASTHHIISLSHGEFLKKINQKNEDGTLVISKYPVSFQETHFITKVDNVQSNIIYFPSDWDYFKAYIPAGATVSIQFITFPNTALRLHAKFRGDKNNIFDHVHPIMTGFTNEFQEKLLSNKQYTVDASIINNASIRFNNLSEGGWLYFSLVGDVSGYYENPPGYVELTLRYEVEIADKDTFYSHLKSLKYTSPTGDPVDATQYLHVKNPVNPDNIQEYNLTLYTGGEGVEIEESKEETEKSSVSSERHIKETNSVSVCRDKALEELGLCGGKVLEAFQSTTSSLSQSSSSSVQEMQNQRIEENAKNKNDVIEKITNALMGKYKKINGYFIHYDSSDIFGWIYITRHLNIIKKLKGWSGSSIEWEDLSDCFTAKKEGEEITLIKKDSCEDRNIENSSSEDISNLTSSSVQSSSIESSSSSMSGINQESFISTPDGRGTLPVPSR